MLWANLRTLMGDAERRPARAALFRLEFGGVLGWGHLVRSGALAGELRARGWRCDLWTSGQIDAVPRELREPFAGVIRFETSSCASVPSGYDWLVVDHYGSDDEQLRAWRAGLSGRARILGIDDEAKRRFDAADLVLNARLGLRESPYAGGVAALLGEGFALLRPGLREPSAPSWRPGPEVTPVLVMLGGTDPAGAAEPVLNALADVDANSLVPIYVRPDGWEPAALGRFPLAVCPGAVNARELAGWAGVSRFAISAAGGTLYELAALGLPFVSVVVAENQQAVANEVERRWGMPQVAAGPALMSDLAGAVRRLRVNLENARAALIGIDARGAMRVAEAMGA